jgi:SAM-dependent methyltransferase
MRSTWMAGDFGVIARNISGDAEAFIARLAIPAGSRVLDVACGTGNTAIPLARSGCIVTGVDIAPNLLVQARERAAAEGLSAPSTRATPSSFPTPTPASTPSPPCSAPCSPRAPNSSPPRLARVLKPGGLLAMANWNPASFSGQMFKVGSKHAPPPPGIAPPVLWGDDATVRQRLAAGFTNIQTELIPIDFDLPMDPAGAVAFFRQYFGPTQVAFSRLDAPGQAALAADLDRPLVRRQRRPRPHHPHPHPQRVPASHRHPQIDPTIFLSETSLPSRTLRQSLSLPTIVLMPTEPIRTAVLGYGLAGRVFHCPFVHAVPGLELSAIVVGNPERAAAAAAAYPSARIVATTAAEAFADPAIDLIVVGTPNDTHVELATAALKAGKHVVVDKPLAGSSADARALITLASAQKKLLAPFHNRRHDGDFLTVRKLLADGTLGRVVQVLSHYDRFRPLQRPNTWKESGAGNGLLFDLGPHLVDQAVALFGSPTHITASVRRDRDKTDIEDAVDIAFDFTVNWPRPALRVPRHHARRRSQPRASASTAPTAATPRPASTRRRPRCSAARARPRSARRSPGSPSPNPPGAPSPSPPSARNPSSSSAPSTPPSPATTASFTPTSATLSSASRRSPSPQRTPSAPSASSNSPSNPAPKPALCPSTSPDTTFRLSS